MRPLIPLPRGMSDGFYAFMSAGCTRSESGELLMLGNELPAKDCQHCEYHADDLRDDGKGGKLHCYMFRDEPESDYCGQFRPNTSTPDAGRE